MNDGEENIGECGECGGMNCKATVSVEDYIVYYNCSDCGYNGHDYFEDLYGCMSVPWGFLL
jgi:hypothetical protein